MKIPLVRYIVPSAIVVAASVFAVSQVVAAVAQPANFGFKASSACQISSQWDKVTGASSYTLQTASNDTFTSNVNSYNTTLGNPRSTVVYYNLTGLAPNTSLYGHVSAGANGQNSTWTSPILAQTPSAPATSTPYFTAAAGEYGNKQIRIDFTTAAGIMNQYASWEIQYATDGGSGFSSWQTIQSQVTMWNGTYYIDNGNGSYLNTSNAYQYRVLESSSDLGCSTRWNSAYSSPIVIPTVPTNLKATPLFDINRTPNNYVSLTWTPSIDATGYQVYRDSGSGFQSIGTSASPSFTDNNVSPTQNYSYEVRAYNSANSNAQSYSDFSVAAQTSTHGAPSGFTAYISNIFQDQTTGKQMATVSFSWNNDFPGYDYYVDGASGMNATAGFSVVASAGHASSSTKTMTASANMAAGSGYTFCVFAKFGGTPGACSPTVSIDTNVTPLSGYAWSGYTASGTTSGIGWIDFGPEGTSPGVYMNNTTGQLSGYAWSSNMGWLSFNASDVQNCPSGACTAQIQNGQIGGWARFTAANSSLGSWDGWVSLSGHNNLPPGNAGYVSWGGCVGKQAVPSSPNLCSGAATASDQLNGYAWGGDVTGWISWSGTATDGSAYAVTVGATSGQAPQNIKATAGPCLSPTNCSINVQWTNPQSYKQINIEVSMPNQPNMGDKTKFNPKRSFKASNSGDGAYLAATTTPMSYTITGLDSSAIYGIFVRGCSSDAIKACP